ncbi:cutinase family protein [Mycolicibacterium sediminis]|uniref:Cutinase n=1 Tax=Mycolicibacterium sediminis TaxID=1286180 RepID=A0A7I7QPQ1_9MYCO|nr:cutinase family protein [Mycolicibacterium sediminis]BBY28353.1 cutinase [Mycolicibacterium sediminis]
MIRRHVIAALSATLVAGGLLSLPSVVAPGTAPTASAACSDVEVIFARGRLEPAGPGLIGNAFVSALRAKSGKSVNMYAVRYPADNQIDVGANDMNARILSTMNSCPETRIVLGGYSLGAAVTDVAVALPFSVLKFDSPMPPGADQHVAAIALFGNGSAWAGPLGSFNPLYRERTIEMCHGADPICNPADPNTWEKNWSDHAAKAYIDAGMVNEAADFAAVRV